MIEEEQTYTTEQLLQDIKRAGIPVSAIQVSDLGDAYDIEYWFSYKKESDSMFVEAIHLEKHLTTPEEFVSKHPHDVWRIPQA